MAGWEYDSKIKRISMLTNFELGQAATEYAHDQLKRGNTYANVLLSTGYTGTIHTFLPSGIKIGKNDDLKSTQLTLGTQISAKIRDRVVDLASTFLAQKGRLALIETYYYPEDVVNLIGIPMVAFFKNEVYYLLRSEHSRNLIAEGFSSARDYPFICGLLDSEEIDATISSNQHLPENFWPLLAGHTKHVIIGAFDAQGYLVWTKTA